MSQGDFVYFFFRETAVEYMNCGKVRKSAVADPSARILELEETKADSRRVVAAKFAAGDAIFARATRLRPQKISHRDISGEIDRAVNG